MSFDSLVHRFVAPTDVAKKPLLLLHRTGVSETALIPLAQELWSGAALLAPRGSVLEEGKPRFFRRIARGEFDRDDLLVQTRGLGKFVRSACKRYSLDAPIAFGHSNGANIAWSLMFAEPGVLSGAISSVNAL